MAKQDSDSPHICITTEINDRAIVRIADNGSGMSEEVRQHLFEPMFTTKPNNKGTGLGLSISQQIVVEKHQGELTCHSVMGEGTEFAIALPVGSRIKKG